ncbi:hypothetical protein ASG35_26585 [Burkholderia sp. Leaf177]|uniref:orotidine 5'-phosphate decarboxylase / HUMPS family protein n=1 Tax=Burkholderia sp. Leaf177 TaxID=1736287 RepID=UPI0006F6F330|nr:hypothetical protein ASG35_26585 [Burkholderia sp. Leaf177]
MLDAKRGNTGSTAEQYATEAFDRYKADAVLVNPYMGFDSVQLYPERKGKDVIMLCRASNAGDRIYSSLCRLTLLYNVLARLAAEKGNGGSLGWWLGIRLREKTKS